MKYFVAFIFLSLFSGAVSYCSSDEKNLNNVAEKDSKGKSPDGQCYSHVADYIDAVGYGGIDKGGFNDAIPPAYWQYAYQFAEYLNTGDNAAELCLENVQSKYSNNPYKAPTGTIVVVRAGTPGTANPVAGDIAVVGDGDYFWNGGEMGYGGSSNFPPSNDYVLGIYAPTACCGHCDGGGGGDSCPSECQTCVENAGGKACVDRCDGCSDDCINCINGGGGTGCSSKCAPTVSTYNPYVGVNMSDVNGRMQYRPKLGDTCTGPHEFCCPAPQDDPNNCPDAARTSDCDAQKSCCCA